MTLSDALFVVTWGDLLQVGQKKIQTTNDDKASHTDTSRGQECNRKFVCDTSGYHSHLLCEWSSAYWSFIHNVTHGYNETLAQDEQ